MFTRRQFLARSALVSLAPLAPAFLSRSLAEASVKKDEHILVVLQLDGGNDGLNTVIPYADENYARFRRELRIPPKDILKLNDEVGLHPALKPMAEMLQDGRLTILPGVGYPNPDRSHFRSMAIWHQGRPDAEENSGYGWLGRAMDASPAVPETSADAVFVGSQNVPRALWGRRSQVITLNRASDLSLPADFPATAGQQPATADSDDLASYVNRVVDRTYHSARRFAEQPQLAGSATAAGYPDSDLAQQLSLVSLMIKNELAARIFYVSQPGYDTHSGQLGSHQRLLRNFAGAVKAFFDDLAGAKLQDRVVLLAFSEFGRRLEENESAGTDHGAAGPVFLAGPATVGGVIGQYPSLTDLDDGDLKMSVDFRGVYAALLNDWLRIPSETILPGDFPHPRLFR